MIKKNTFGILLIALLFISININAQTEEFDVAGNLLKQSTVNNKNVIGDEIIITTTTGELICVISADIDGDGDNDVISANRGNNTITWFDNLDGLGDFDEGNLITDLATDVSNIYAVDIDGDGDLDIFAANNGEAVWYENTDGAGTFSAKNIIGSLNIPLSVFGADLDGDDDIDLLTNSVVDDKVVWFENTDGLGTFGTENVVATGVDGAYCVFAYDIDNDLDMDIVSSSWADDKIVWFENTDGAATFGTANIISSIADRVAEVYVCDLDNDGYGDVMYANRETDEVVWQKNNGDGTFGLENSLTNTADQATNVKPIDADNDGDMDILFGSQDDDKIGWFENTDGFGDFGPEIIIATTSNKVRSIFVADIDNNGTDDVIAASSIDNKIVWFYNEINAPTEQALNIVISDILENSATINWENGNGSKRVAFITEANTGEVLPVDNTIYVANTEFGSGDEIDGWFCVFNETTYTVTVTGLTPETEYRVMICEYNGEQNFEVYLTTTNTDNPVNFTTLVSNINQIADNFSIYPNPATSSVNIDLNNNIENTVKVIDISGKEILTYNNVKNNLTIDLSNFSNGIYILQIANKNEIKSTKLVIE